MNKKSFGVIIGVFAIGLVLAGGYLAWAQKEKAESLVVKTSQMDTSDWKTYQNLIHNYSFKYPRSNYEIDDSDPSGEGHATPGEFGNFLWKDRGLPTYEDVFAVNVLRTPEWTTVGTEADALEKGFKEGGIKEVAELSRKINLSKEENFSNKKVSDVKEFFFSNGSGYGFTVTDTFAFGFNSARKDGINIGGKIVEGERVFVYATDGKNIYNIEFANRPLERQIFSTLKFTESVAKADISNWKTYTNTELNYSVKYPSGWFIYEPAAGSSIDEVKEVIFSQKFDPQFGGEAEEDVGPYLSISLDPRSVEQMREVMKNIGHNQETIGYFDGLTTYSYTPEEENTPDYSSYVMAIPYNGKTYWLSTSKLHVPEVKTMIKSFQFID